MSDRKGRIDIAQELLLDWLCLDPKTHRVERVDMRDEVTLSVVVAGPTMPDAGSGVVRVTPVYKRRDWDLTEIRT